MLHANFVRLPVLDCYWNVEFLDFGTRHSFFCGAATEMVGQNKPCAAWKLPVTSVAMTSDDHQITWDNE